MVTTVYGDATDGIVRDDDTTWSNLDVDGASLPSPTIDSTSLVDPVERWSNGSSFGVSQAFFEFDTSGVASSTAASCFIKINTLNGNNVGSQTLKMLSREWVTLATTLFLASTSWGAHSLIADVAITDGLGATEYEFVYADPTDINTGGTSGTQLVDSSQATAPVDSTEETYAQCTFADQTGTVDDPRLEIDEGAGAIIGGAGFVGPVPVIPPPLMMGY